MKELRAEMDRIFLGLAPLDALFVTVLPFMRDTHEFAGKEGMDDGAKEEERRDEIERLLAYTV
jgi:hypothetical protein